MRTNEWVVGRLGQKPCLLQDIDRRKLSFVGHVIGNKGLGCDLITGMVFGKRKRGRPKMRFVDDIKDVAGICIARIVREEEEDRCHGRSSERPNRIVMMTACRLTFSLSMQYFARNIWMNCSTLHYLLPEFVYPCVRIL